MTDHISPYRQYLTGTQ